MRAPANRQFPVKSVSRDMVDPIIIIPASKNITPFEFRALKRLQYRWAYPPLVSPPYRGGGARKGSGARGRRGWVPAEHSGLRHRSQATVPGLEPVNRKPGPLPPSQADSFQWQIATGMFSMFGTQTATDLFFKQSSEKGTINVLASEPLLLVKSAITTCTESFPNSNECC